MSKEPTNAERGERFFRTLLYYGQRFETGQSHEELVTDLLTDARHFAVDYGFTIDDCNDRAKVHYDAETDPGYADGNDND